MRRFKKLSMLTAVFTVVAVVAAGLAWADEAVVDGDDIVGVSTNGAPLAFGNVCTGSTVNKDVVFAVKKTNGQGNVFKDSSVVTVSVGAPSGTTGLTAVINAPITINIPSNWSGAANDTISPTVTSRVTLVAGSTPRTISGAPAGIPYTATGIKDVQGNGNNSVVRLTTLAVSANVINCDTTPPTLNLPANITREATSAAGATVTYTASATDVAPPSPAVTCTPNSGSTFAITTTTVSCSARDTAGNLATGSFTVTVRDTTGPAISQMPTDVTVEATSAAGALVSYSAPTATDAVDGPRAVTCVPASGSTLPLGVNTITCSASDTRGNTSSSSFKVTVQDTTRPVLTLPGAITKEATGPAGSVATFAATASDSVDGAIVPSCVPPSGSMFALGTTPVTCTAQDSRNNATSGSFNVTTVDTTAPVLTVPASFSREATGPSGAAVTYSATANDLVDGATPAACIPASGSTFPLGATTVTCSATDAHANTRNKSFVVTVLDSTPPTLSLPADVIVEADAANGRIVTYSAAANDLVDGAMSASCAPASGSAFPVGVTTVHCSATDAAGNIAKGQFTVTITDTTAPVITVPDDMQLEATGPNGAVADFTVTASDIVDGAVTATCDPASGSTFALGTTTVNCSTADAHGNKSSNSFTVEVVDSTPPTIASTPTNFDVEAQSAAGAVVTFTAPTATDIVDGNVAVSCIPPSGHTFPLDENTTVTCSATDNAGNHAESTFTVRVSDTKAPLLSLPKDITAEATGPTGAAVDFDASSTDLVDGNVAVDCTPPSGSTFGLGSSSVGCSATDAHGNLASGAFNITVQDTTPPDLTVPAAPIVAEATGPAGAAVSYTATATDLVDGAVTPVCTVDPDSTPAPSGSTFAIGTTTVSCTATDGHGNAKSGSFDITVQDTTAPALTLPADITAEATGPNGAPVMYTATAADLVDGTVTPTCAPATGSTFAIGTTTVSCSATDGHGNTGHGSFQVTVQDTTAPALTLPADITAEATAANGASVSYSAGAVDIVDGPVTPTCVPGSGSTFPLGDTVVSCSAKDAHGNTASGTFRVKVRDTTAPAITGTPSDLVQEATGPSGATVTYTNPTATDLVDGAVATSCVPPSGSTFALDATTQVKCTASDAAGNIGSSTFTVRVDDTQGPALTLPGPITAEATGPSGADVGFLATASDVVDGTVPVQCSPQAGTRFALGSTPVNCSASDAHHNTTPGSFGVTVVDTTPPVLTLPANLTFEATGPSGAVATYLASASDIVDVSVTPSCSRASGATFALGTTTVTCSATDAHGNKSSGSFTVAVVDTTKPVMTLPANRSAIASSAAGAPVSFATSATDLVDGTVAVQCTPTSGSVFHPGVTVVSCTATDHAGNTATGTFTVTVTFALGGGLLPPVNPSALNVVKGGSTVPLKWQVPSPTGGYITSTGIVAAFVLTQVKCTALSTTVTDGVDFTTTGGTSLRYDTTDNQFIQNWQTPKTAGNCYRVDVVFVGGQKLSANFQLK